MRYLIFIWVLVCILSIPGFGFNNASAEEEAVEKVPLKIGLLPEGGFRERTYRITSDRVTVNKKAVSRNVPVGKQSLEGIIEYLSEHYREVEIATSVDQAKNARCDMLIKMRFASFEFKKTDVLLTTIYSPRMQVIYTLHDLKNDKVITNKIASKSKASVGEAAKQGIGAFLKTPDAQIVVRNLSIFQEAPCELTLNLDFDDSASAIPNQTLDAGEQASLLLVVENKAGSPGYEVIVELSASNPNIKLEPQRITLGTIGVGEKKDKKILFTAMQELETGPVAITAKTTEKRGYGAKPVILDVSAKAMEGEPPSLKFGEITPNENSGKRFKNNEEITFSATVENSGTNPAHSVVLRVGDLGGLQAVEETTELGDIASGQRMEGKLKVQIPRAFSGSDFTIVLQAHDGRGIGRIERRLTFPVETLTPTLVFDHKTEDENGNGSLEPGEKIKISVTPKNTGANEAKNVTVRIKSDDVLLIPMSREFASIPAGGTAVPFDFTLDIPKSYDKSNITVFLPVEQLGFPDEIKKIVLPLGLPRATLNLDTSFRNQGGGSEAVLGKPCFLEVTVTNQTGGPVANVRLAIVTKTADVRLLGQTTWEFPSIEAGSAGEHVSVQFVPLRQLEEDHVQFQITLEHKGSNPTVMDLVVNVIEED